MNLIPLHFILKDAGTTVCKKFKMLLTWQTNTWFWVQVGERCWVGQEGIPKTKNTLPDFFFFPIWVQNVCAHSHFINRWYKAGELLSLILQETIAFQVCHHLFMLFQVCVLWCCMSKRRLFPFFSPVEWIPAGTGLSVFKLFFSGCWQELLKYLASLVSKQR